MRPDPRIANRRELLIWAGFALICAAAIWTVVLPELASDRTPPPAAAANEASP